ncbi:RGS domain-containing protein [Phycomyces blakesleeanus]
MTVEDIMQDGLKGMLQSKIPLGYYICHLMEEYSCENLFFYLAVEQYEHHQFETRDDQHIAAKRIYSTYIAPNSQLEINLESKIHKAIVLALLDSDSLLHVFEPAKHHVFELLNLSYHRFISSPLWDTMIAQCGKVVVFYLFVYLFLLTTATTKKTDAFFVYIYIFLERNNY